MCVLYGSEPNFPPLFLIQDYYQSGRMLLSMSQALGRIVLAGRDMSRLSGSVIHNALITQLVQLVQWFIGSLVQWFGGSLVV